jgi:hypothetical protein
MQNNNIDNNLLVELDSQLIDHCIFSSIMTHMNVHPTNAKNKKKQNYSVLQDENVYSKRDIWMAFKGGEKYKPGDKHLLKG